MDCVLISWETARESLMTKHSSVFDENGYKSFSVVFAEALKGELEDELQRDKEFASELRNMRRIETETDTNSETVDKGLLRRQKLSLALEPNENFPAQISREPLARRAAFPAIGLSSEICLPLNISKSSSIPDDWISSLRSDLPSIAESPDEGTATVAVRSQTVTKDKNISSLAASQNAFHEPVDANKSSRSLKSPRSSNCSTNASKLRNSIANKKRLTRSKSENWKIRVHRKIIIDDDIDDSSSQSSRSSSSSRPSSWCGDARAASTFPSIDHAVKKHSY